MLSKKLELEYCQLYCQQTILPILSIKQPQKKLIRRNSKFKKKHALYSHFCLFQTSKI